jgi:hypothetical protein
MNPFQLNEDKGGHQVPCGKCFNCRRRLASSWSLRVVEENKVSTNAIFLTLTYNPEHLPYSSMGRPTLKKQDVKDFMKRLRRLHPQDHKTLRYFTVGEYGGKTQRPHYHLLLFNSNIELIQKAWSLKGREIGHIYIGHDVGEAAAGYCVKYISKICYIGTNQAIDTREPAFRLMSKGLGANYLTDKKIQWHKNKPEERVYIPMLDGKKAPMPRYYKQKIYDEYEREKIAYHFQKKANILKDKEVAEHGDNLQSYKKEQLLNGYRKMTQNKNSKL